MISRYDSTGGWMDLSRPR